MKNVMIAVMLLVTVSMTAQRKQRQEGQKPDMSIQEKATLATKKATLALALDASQSDKMYPIIFEQLKKRESLKKDRMEQSERPSKEERLKVMNERLDDRIAMQRKVKAILNDEQFTKWQKHTAKRGKGRRHSKKRYLKRRK